MITAQDLERSHIRMVRSRYGRGWHIYTWCNLDYPRLTTIEDWRSFRDAPTYAFLVDDIACAGLDDVLTRLNAPRLVAIDGGKAA
jgi:hypothetical protein